MRDRKHREDRPFALMAPDLEAARVLVELGAEEGKHAFGSARWKQLVSRCRDGSVWDDVVRDGYAGVEGDVDADVVVNL